MYIYFPMDMTNHSAFDTNQRTCFRKWSIFEISVLLIATNRQGKHNREIFFECNVVFMFIRVKSCVILTQTPLNFIVIWLRYFRYEFTFDDHVLWNWTVQKVDLVKISFANLLTVLTYYLCKVVSINTDKIQYILYYLYIECYKENSRGLFVSSMKYYTIATKTPYIICITDTWNFHTTVIHYHRPSSLPLTLIRYWEWVTQ